MAAMLCDDALRSILSHITDVEDKKSFTQVCKSWMQFDGRNRLSIRVLKPEFLPLLLVRFPNLVTIQTTQTIGNAELEHIAQLCPNVEVIDLGTTILRVTEESVWNEGLCAVAKGCHKLSKVVLKRRLNIGHLGFASLITSARNLTHLDLTWCYIWVTDNSIRVIVESNCSKTLKVLVLENCHKITDHGVVHLQQMCVLEELNLGSCNLTDEVGGAAISKIATLKKLNLSGQQCITNLTIAAIANNCTKLETLDLSRLGHNVSLASLLVFSGHACFESVDLSYTYCFSSFYGHVQKRHLICLERLAHECPSLMSIVVDIYEGPKLLCKLAQLPGGNVVSRLIKFG